MKKSTKFVAALLIGAMTLSMAGCQSKEEKTTSSSVTAASSVDTESVSEVATSYDFEDVLADSYETVATSATSESVESTSEEFNVGASAGAEYTNETFNLKFALPDGWSFFDEAQMEQLNATIGDKMNSKEVADAIKSGKAYIDMYASTADQLKTVNINLADAHVDIEAAGGADIMMSDTVLNTTKNALEAQGITGLEVTKGTTTFLGKADTPAIIVKGEFNGVEVHETLVYAISGHYLATITAASFGEDVTQDILNGFTTLN
ncbi:MAG: hypothetical protein K5744_01240 [Eubacterium sp.]|nr:hypothetical protein [Eubacterium sp.]